jgi:hypothetical protein
LGERARGKENEYRDIPHDGLHNLVFDREAE